MTAVIAASATNNAADPTMYPAYAAAFVLVVGVVFLIAGLARVGYITQFLSKPVMEGFVVGLATFVAVGQLYIVLRVLVRLRFAASQTSLFQSRLAHAGYVARPVPRWPDSPAAEALRAL